jgi:hypothetical protein
LVIFQSNIEGRAPGLLVRVSDPTLTTDLQTSMLDAEVCERHNHVEVSFASGVDPVAELARVERLAWAWRLAGHADARTEVTLP